MYDGNPRKTWILFWFELKRSSSFGGFELSGAYGGEGLFEVERFSDASHETDYVIQSSHQLIGLPYYKVR